MARVFVTNDFNRYEALSATLGVPTAPRAAHVRVANLHDSDGHYYVANGDGAGIRVRRADGPTPRSDLGGFVLDTHASTDPRDVNPAFLQAARGEILLYFERAGSVYCVETGDRGVTWSDPVSQIPGILPAAATGKAHGEEVLVAVQSDNTLQGTCRHLGDRWPNDTHTGSSEGTSSSAPFTLLDDTGAALTTDGTGPALSAPPDGSFVLAVRIGSETDLSHWRNGDFGRTWKRVT